MNTKVIITAEDQTGAGIASVKSSMVALGAAIGAVSSVTTKLIDMLGEVARTTVALYKDQINLADSMDEMSTRMGMSIKDMTVWKAAAEMNGTSLEAMANGTRMLAKHMTEHGDALRKAGIDTKDTNQAFLQLSDLFKNITDPVQRIDLATRLFGRGLGQQLLPVLIQGREALEEIQSSAGKYGEALQALSPEAQKLNDTMYLMGVNFKQAAAEGVFPLVKSFNDEMLPALREVAKEGSFLKTLWVGFGGAMKIGFADPWNQTLLGAKASLQQFMADVEAMLAKITFGRVSELHLRESQRMADAAKKTLAEAAGKTSKPDVGADVPEIPESNSDAEAAALAASLRSKGSGKAGPKTPLQKMIELGERNLAESRRKEFASVDDDEEARLAAEKTNKRSLELQKHEADALEKQRQKYIAMADPLQKYREQLDEINALREKGALTAEQAIEAEWAVNEAMDKTIDKMGEVKDGGKNAFAELSQAIASWGNKAADTFADFVVDGKASFSDLINSMLKDIVRLQAKRMFDPVTQAASGWLSGGGLGRLFGFGDSMSSGGYNPLDDSVWMPSFEAPSWDGGGYTGNGSRSGGLDGKGGFWAIMHPQETVTDHTLGGGSGVGGEPVSVQINFAVGIAQTVRAEVMSLMPQIQAATTAGIVDARRRGGAMRAAFAG